MQGLYRPTPAVINAPRIKLTIPAITSFPPASPMASPPIGINFKRLASMMHAVHASANPITRRIFFSDMRETTPAPRTAPSIAAASMTTSVHASTLTTVVKISACSSTGIQLATFIVPGISLSRVCFVNFSNAVCGANAPIPSGSKKFTRAPIAPVFHQEVSPSNSSLCLIRS